jgi:hypothetical protein
MTAPLNPSITDSLPESLLSDVRALLSQRPALVDHPERLAALLGTDVFEVLAVLEALTVEGEVLA